jgi:hypothetical protein
LGSGHGALSVGGPGPSGGGWSRKLGATAKTSLTATGGANLRNGPESPPEEEDRAVQHYQHAGAEDIAQLSNVEILTEGGGVCELRCNWLTFSYRYKTVDTYFGTSFYTLDTAAAQPLIAVCQGGVNLAFQT